jgi:hypothetical protein
MAIKQTYIANPAKINKIQYNIYLSHKDNKTIIFGNTTMNIPLDDTLFVSGYNWVKESYIQQC